MNYDVFFNNFGRSKEKKLFGAYSKALCERQFSGPIVIFLDESTVQKSTSYVTLTSIEPNRQNQIHEEDGELR